MILLGLILLVVGLVVPNGLLVTVGLILLIVGLVLVAVGSAGHTLGGRRYWW